MQAPALAAPVRPPSLPSSSSPLELRLLRILQPLPLGRRQRRRAVCAAAQRAGAAAPPAVQVVCKESIQGPQLVLQSLQDRESSGAAHRLCHLTSLLVDVQPPARGGQHSAAKRPASPQAAPIRGDPDPPNPPLSGRIPPAPPPQPSSTAPTTLAPVPAAHPATACCAPGPGRSATGLPPAGMGVWCVWVWVWVGGGGVGGGCGCGVVGWGVVGCGVVWWGGVGWGGVKAQQLNQRHQDASP